MQRIAPDEHPEDFGEEFGVFIPFRAARIDGARNLRKLRKMDQARKMAHLEVLDTLIEGANSAKFLELLDDLGNGNTGGWKTGKHGFVGLQHRLLHALGDA